MNFSASIDKQWFGRIKNYLRKETVLLLTTITIFFGCKKDDPLASLEGQYKSDTNMNIGPIIMYTSRGQVTNSANIQAFLRRKRADNDFTLSSSFALSPTDRLTLTITENKMVDISYLGNIQAEIISQTRSEIVVAHVDSTDFYISNIYDRCGSLISAMTKVNPEKKYYKWPYISGYTGMYRFRPVFPIEIKNGQLLLPLMTYLVSSTEGTGSCFSSVGNGWNSFNSDIKRQLRNGDTIVYQQKTIRLLKQ